MAQLKINNDYLRKYLEGVFGQKISNLKISKLGKGCLGIGYALDFVINNQKQRKILKTLFPVHLGHDYQADRAQTLILAHHDYQKMDKHIRSFDVCGLHQDGQIVSLGNAQEFFILMDEAKGKDYFDDLARIAKTNQISLKDEKRAIILADFLANLHKNRHKSDSLYQRKIRDTVGSGQSIMGVLDSYPQKTSWLKSSNISDLVKKAVEFWSKDRYKTYRLCQIHGDFHPGNIWWQNDQDFILLDRARGQYGEAADDLAALLINPIFFSMIYQNSFSGGLKKIFDLFINRYLSLTKDSQIAYVIQPYFAFRTVVVCNPLFYPDSFYPKPLKANQIRKKMFNFGFNVLKKQRFLWHNINQYF